MHGTDKPASGQRNSANDYQVGGNHYQTGIQHWDYVLANEIPYLEAMAIKYLTRWRKKGGYDDVRKAQHFLQKLFEAEGLDWITGQSIYATQGPVEQPTDTLGLQAAGVKVSTWNSIPIGPKDPYKR